MNALGSCEVFCNAPQSCGEYWLVDPSSPDCVSTCELEFGVDDCGPEAQDWLDCAEPLNCPIELSECVNEDDALNDCFP